MRVSLSRFNRESFIWMNELFKIYSVIKGSIYLFFLSKISKDDCNAHFHFVFLYSIMGAILETNAYLLKEKNNKLQKYCFGSNFLFTHYVEYLFPL